MSRLTLQPPATGELGVDLSPPPDAGRAVTPTRGGAAHPTPPAARRNSMLVPLLVVGASVLYTSLLLQRGWIPHDDGSLAQAAERVLLGELPHRDFDDIYTGGLAALNAAAFTLFGTTLWALRFMLLLAFTGWVSTVYYIASRMVRPAAAAGATLLTVAWSVPNYPAAMPSWYNLFFATFGVAALFRFLERGGRGWLVAAGVAGGLSILAKVVGLYYVAAVLLFLAFRVHEDAPAGGESNGRPARAYALFVSACMLLFAGALVALVRRELHVPGLFQFVLPGALVAMLVAGGAWRRTTASSRARFGTLMRQVMPFLLGVSLPIVVFLIPYVLSDSVGALVHGVFILPAKRFSSASLSMPPMWTTLAVVPSGLLVFWLTRRREPLRTSHLAVFALALAVLLVMSGVSGGAHRSVWFALRSLPPLIVLAGVVALVRGWGRDDVTGLRRQQLLLLVSVTALCTLVQFPFSAPIYFVYVAPLLVLTCLPLGSRIARRAPVAAALLMTFLALFAVLWMHRGHVYTMGVNYVRYPATRPMGLERAGVAVFPPEDAQYAYTVSLLRQHARGEYIWASPDAPEVYFLAGFRNPTRSLFEFFDDPVGYDERLLRTLEERGVTAVVLHRSPAFSAPISEQLHERLALRYPAFENVGKFQVRWQP